MPSYVCTTVVDRLSADQRGEIARAITRAHHETTGAPAYFARVQFDEVDPHAVFVGGAPLDHDHVFVFGHIRGGRDNDTRSALISAITAGVSDAADIDRRGVWVYLADLRPSQMVEFGHVLPEAGDEAAWQRALPDADRRWMASLGVERPDDTR